MKRASIYVVSNCKKIAKHKTDNIFSLGGDYHKLETFCDTMKSFFTGNKRFD